MDPIRIEVIDYRRNIGYGKRYRVHQIIPYERDNPNIYDGNSLRDAIEAIERHFLTADGSPEKPDTQKLIDEGILLAKGGRKS